MPGRAEPAKQGLPSGSWNLEEILFYCQRQRVQVCVERILPPLSLLSVFLVASTIGRSQALKNAALWGTDQGKEGRHWVGLGRAAEGE